MRNFAWIGQQMKNFPIENCEIVKIARFLQRNVAESREIFTMGVYGKILYPLSDLNEIWHQSLSKTFQ